MQGIRASDWGTVVFWASRPLSRVRKAIQRVVQCLRKAPEFYIKPTPASSGLHLAWGRGLKSA